MVSHKCKGARDLLPKDTEIFRHIEDVFRHTCTRWGYHEVRTPTLEYLHLFTTAGTLTPSKLNKVYSFLDWDGWSGERVVLRPDGTIPVARLYVENLSQQQIARLFYVTNVFAFEETGKENRERWQCGVELIGSDKTTSDVELILLATKILQTLNISDIEIQLSHAGILKALLKELKLSPDEETSLMDQIFDGNWQVLTKTDLGNSHVGKFLSLLLGSRGKSSSYLKNLKAMPQISAELKAQLDNFIEIAKLLDAMDFNYQIDVTSTRGFEYYTGLCFKFSASGTILGSGGRYDNLISLIGGKSTPACGFALYIEPMTSVQPKPKQKSQQEVLIRCNTMALKAIKTCFEWAESLREAGCVVEIDFDGSQSDRRWIITVQGEPQLFLITDQSQNLKREISSVAQAANLIGGSS